MAKASEQFRQSDVTTWGLVAMVLCAVAVMGANVSAMIPSSILGGLHKTRIEGASMEQLRLQIADLRDQSLQLKRENGQLLTRFALEEQQGNEVVQRVGALEVSLPKLLEALPNTASIDRSTLTSSIGEEQSLVYDADGGSVVIKQRPMSEAQPASSQPLPALAPVSQSGLASPSQTAYGVALGRPVPAANASEAWRDFSIKLGPLLLGLQPLMADEPTGDSKRIVVGPIAEMADARALCTRLEQISIACVPRPFTGTPLNLPTSTQ